jgi:TolA-binding protein
VEEATTALQEVVGGSLPTDTLGGTARALLARAHLAAGQDQQARELLEALLADANGVVPKDHVLLDLADIRERAGDRQAAREFLERIVEEHPRGPAAVEARRRLESAS